MSVEHDALMLRAIEAVETAARVTSAVQAGIDLASLQKGDKSPVTAADFASQAVVCRTLGEKIPLVGEEASDDLRSDAAFLDRVVSAIGTAGIETDGEEACGWIDRGGHDASAERYWTLDPIDGTKGFLRKEQYAISLALIEGGIVTLGVVGCPNLPTEGLDGSTVGTLQFAYRDRGAYQRPLGQPDAEPTRLTVTELEDASAVRFCESVESGHSSHSHSSLIADRLNLTAEPVRLDSQAKYSVVARGDADAYLRLPTRPGYEERIWDHAGGVLVVEEAGGVISDVDGKPLDFARGATLAGNRGVVAAAPGVHAAVLEAVCAVLAGDGATA